MSFKNRIYCTLTLKRSISIYKGESIILEKRVSGEVEWFEFPMLRSFPQVKHAIFLKGQGFDLGEKGGDSNQNLALETLGLEKGVKLKQLHKAQLVTSKKAKMGWTLHEGYDGVITREKGVGLMIRHADCQAALFFDPKTQTIANVHCGWRGSCENIYRETVRKMGHLYGCDPRSIRVSISPSLGPEKAEFKHYRRELPESFWKYQVKPNYFDFWEISRQQLLKEGVLQEHIECANICTYSHPEECFSYRRNPLTGHHGTIIALKIGCKE